VAAHGAVGGEVLTAYFQSSGPALAVGDFQSVILPTRLAIGAFQQGCAPVHARHRGGAEDLRLRRRIPILEEAFIDGSLRRRKKGQGVGKTKRGKEPKSW